MTDDRAIDIRNRQAAALSPSLIRLRPGFQRYSWGDPSFVGALFGEPSSATRPCAEAWLGDHPAAPATAILADGRTPLDSLLEQEGLRLLGPEISSRFGGLPYLLKVLAAARPLSIQVHPTAEQAVEGFRRENDAGIPIDAPHRLYRDSNPKPELIVALGTFYALSGFRPAEEIATQLALMPDIAGLLPRFDGTQAGLAALVRTCLELPREELDPAVERLLNRIATDSSDRMTDLNEIWPWMLSAHRQLSSGGPPDRGLLLLPLLNLVRLDPGQALFTPPGTPHAYLRGAAVEVMASSDTTLRCGLTSKHVDAGTFLEVSDLRGGPARIVVPVVASDGEERYPAPVAQFVVSRITAGPQNPRLRRRSRGPEVLLCVTGSQEESVAVRTDAECVAMGRGGACLVADGTAYRVESPATSVLFRVRTESPGR